MRRRILPLAGLIFALVLTPLDADAQYPSPGPDPSGPPPPPYAFADLRIQVTPKQAAVYVDGYHAGKVDDFDGTFQRLRLEAGQHEIAIYLPGFRTLRQLVYLSPPQARRISGTLEPLAPGEPDSGPPRPTNRPNTDDLRRPPPNAEPAAPPPPPQAPAPPSEPAPGFRPVTRFGTLSIRVDPGNAELVIDGERRTTGSSDERLLIQVTDGRHRIEASRRGYLPYSNEVEVRPGDTLDLDISLTRQP